MMIKEIPCKIGDSVYMVRKYKGIPKILCGRVSQMFYVGEEMKLCIVVDKIGRGSWGNGIFKSYEDAERWLVSR